MIERSYRSYLNNEFADLAYAEPLYLKEFHTPAKWSFTNCYFCPKDSIGDQPYNNQQLVMNSHTITIIPATGSEPELTIDTLDVKKAAQAAGARISLLQ